MVILIKWLRIPLRSWIGITSRQPRSYTRDDIADRSIYLRFKRIDKSKRIAESEIYETFMDKRPDIVTDVIYTIQGILESMALADNDKAQITSDIRMMDFARFCLSATYNNEENYKKTQDMLTQLAAEQVGFLQENSEIYNVIIGYLQSDKTFTYENKWTDFKTASQLNSIFHDLANSGDITYHKNSNGNSLAQKLRQLTDFEHVIEMEEKQKRNKGKQYRFRFIRDGENRELGLKGKDEKENKTIDDTDEIPF